MINCIRIFLPYFCVKKTKCKMQILHATMNMQMGIRWNKDFLQVILDWSPHQMDVN